MTYLVENEQAALVVPAGLLARVHPHFREVGQLLAVQATDEARHFEVFSRRAMLRGGPMGTSSAGGRSSLATLLSEPDFTVASFLLSCWAKAAPSRCWASSNSMRPTRSPPASPTSRVVTRLAT